ncbi:hypothetical protein Hanom_Chr14g01300661 [Helianthus anomalus]
MTKLEISDGGSKTYIFKTFYRARESKTYIPKIFYTKSTYITLLSEKFGGRKYPPPPLSNLRQWLEDLFNYLIMMPA